MVRKSTLFILLFFLSLSTFAQRGYSLKVKLLDSLSKEPVSAATIYLSKKGTPEGAYFSSIDDKGMGVISNVPEGGKYYFVASMMGYKEVKKIVELKEKITDLGVIFMQENVEMMESVVVKAVGNAIVVKKDTIEYNAASFKISDNDMLEDLLKKLPGVEVDKDGSITANGEKIEKIMVQGKEFFLNDPKLATKNIPANIVQKVKVLEKKSKQAEFTGIDDGEEQTVIDLMIKPGMMDSSFGNITGGGGMDMLSKEHDARYQVSGILGHFADKLQVVILGNGNNTNNRGFNDMASEMSGGMRMGGFGGGQGGIVTSWMGGTNVNYSFSPDRELGGNYLYNRSKRKINEHSQRTTFIDDSQSLVTDKSKINNYFKDGHRAGVTLDYKFNDKSSIYFQPRFNYGNNRINEEGNYSTDNTLSGKINDGNSRTTEDGFSWNTRGELLLRQRIGKKKGRTISFDGHYNLTNSSVDGANYSITNTFRNNIKKDSTLVDQYYDRKEKRYSLRGNITYTEPLGKNFFLLGSYQLQWSRSLSEKLTYDRATGMLIDTFSNNMNNRFLNHVMQLSVMKQEEKYNLQVGFNAQPFTTGTKSKIGVIRDTTYTFWNFAPSVRFDYRFSKNEYLRINYYGSTSQPTIDQLMPAPDNADPLNIALGNPSLKPEFRNRLRLSYRYTDLNTYTTYSLRSNFNYTKDNIVNAKWYDGSGIQYRLPVNSKGPAFGANLMFMLNAQIKKSGFSIMSFTMSSFNTNLTYTVRDTAARSINEVKNKLVGGRTTSLNVTENLSFVYRNDFLETRLGGRVSYKNAWYEISSQKQAETWDNRIFGEVTATLPWGMEIRSDINYDFYAGYDKGFGEPVCTWNAEISQLFFKKRMTLRFKVYDILNRAKNNYITTAENYVEERYNNTLGQYFIVSLIYRFGSDNLNKFRNSQRHGYRRR